MLGAARRLRRGARSERCGSRRMRPILAQNAANDAPARKSCCAATSPGRKVRQYKTVRRAFERADTVSSGTKRRFGPAGVSLRDETNNTQTASAIVLRQSGN